MNDAKSTAPDLSKRQPNLKWDIFMELGKMGKIATWTSVSQIASLVIFLLVGNLRYSLMKSASFPVNRGSIWSRHFFSSSNFLVASVIQRQVLLNSSVAVFGSNGRTLFRKKRFALSKMFQQNASKFAIFYV